MRIGIDCRMAGTGEGIGRYVGELVQHLGQIDRKNQYFLIHCGGEPVFPLAAGQLPNNFQAVRVRSGYYSMLEQTYFIWELLRMRLDLVHFASFNVPIFYPKKFIVTIHDVIHHQFPGRKKSRILHRLAYRAVIWSAAARARKIIAVSEATKAEIVKTFKIRPDEISVIYEGADRKFTTSSGDAADVLAHYQITKPFLFFVGVWRQYKNLPRLAAAFDIIRNKYQIDCQLVFAGKIDDFYPEIKAQVLGIKNASNVRVLGFVPEPDLAALYSAAKIFVFPSLVEGFGLVGIEAQAASVPVVASDIPVLREVLGNGAVYFDPDSTTEMAEKISKTWQDERGQPELVRAARENAMRYDWRKTARETLNLYNSIV